MASLNTTVLYIYCTVSNMFRPHVHFLYNTYRWSFEV